MKTPGRMKVKLAAAALAVLGLVALLQACSPIRILNLDLDRAAYTAQREIAYGPHARMTLDLYAPAIRPAAARPVIVWVYGGSWASGSKADYEFIASWLTRLGHVVVIPDYRLYPDVRFPAFVEDIAAAVAWAAGAAEVTDAGGDARRMILMGHSAGAYNAAMVALDDQWLRAAGGDAGAGPGVVAGFVGIAGPYDFYPYDVRATRNAFGHIDDPQITQPVKRVTGTAPRTLLLHGADDTTVYPRNSQALAAAITAAGGEASLVMIADTDHKGIVAGLSPLLSNRAVQEPIEEFLGFYR